MIEFQALIPEWFWWVIKGYLVIWCAVTIAKVVIGVLHFNLGRKRDGKI